MKLLQKTNRYYLVFSAILFLIAGGLLYFILTTIVDEEVSEKLTENKNRIIQHLTKGEAIFQLPPVIEIEELQAPQSATFSIKDTMLYDPIQQEPDLFREVNSVETINNKTYRIIVRQVILEPHDYYTSIGLAMVIVMTLLLLGLFLLNKEISRKLWKPFYENLNTLKSFSLQEDRFINLKPADIKEFQELNTALEKLTEKVRSDYQAQKEFTENASHEMQTPLAIIQAKLELLLQSDNINEEQAGQIKSAYSAVQRLSKLNEALLLLTKIDNRQFVQNDNISIFSEIEKQLTNFEDFISAKNLHVSKNIENEITVTSGSFYIETLLSNIISNSIKHNLQNGKIKIELENKTLTISNTGKPLSIQPEKLFERFSKADASSTSLGLGLAIIKRICESSGWQISYIIQEEWHILKINF